MFVLGYILASKAEFSSSQDSQELFFLRKNNAWLVSRNESKNETGWMGF